MQYVTPTFTSRTQHVLFTSADAPLTFELRPCWLVPVNWCLNLALHINVNLISHWYLIQHIWMTLSGATAGNHLNGQLPPTVISISDWRWLALFQTLRVSFFCSDGTAFRGLPAHILAPIFQSECRSHGRKRCCAPPRIHADSCVRDVDNNVRFERLGHSCRHWWTLNLAWKWSYAQFFAYVGGLCKINFN